MFFNAVLLEICIMEKEMSFFNRNKVILEIQFYLSMNLSSSRSEFPELASLRQPTIT